MTPETKAIHGTDSVSICVCTFRRVHLLDVLLRALMLQRLDDTSPLPEIVVVDNDPQHSAKDLLTSWQDRVPGRLVFLHEPTPNISLARNAAIAATRGKWIAFIDDDEEPRSDWLAQLMATQRATDAGAVFAPVVPRYSDAVAPWLIAGGFFDRRRFTTGAPIDEKDARTGNVLISAAALKSLPGPFDPAFGRSGGEDSLLFRALLARGCRFVWCDAADVSEEVPAERANGRWLLQRSFRTGQIWMRVELHNRPGFARWPRGLYLGCRAVLQLFVATCCALVCAPISRIIAFRWLRVAVSQCGKLTGLTAYRSIAYGH